MFSREDVARRVGSEFVPVALKAALVNNPPPGVEGRFLREIGRSRPAPQGICVASPAGKVLAWALSFDDEASVPRFLDHALGRARASRDAATPIPAERFMRFPGRPLEETADTREPLPELAAHPDGERCPAAPRRARGTVVARVWGRAVGKDGAFASDCRSQERYVEDIVDIPSSLQADLARGAAAAPAEESFAVPAGLARLLATHAYLGQLDVRPLDSPVPGIRGDARALALTATRLDGGDSGSMRLRIGGRTEVSIDNRTRPGDGASFFHAVALDWQGFTTIEGERITELLLHAEGRERLRWGNPVFAATAAAGAPDVARLPAGRAIDLDTAVRYGVIGRPVPDAEAVGTDDAADAPRRARPDRGGPPEGVRRRLERLHRLVGRLLREGRADVIERALDRALELLEEKRQTPGGTRE